MANVIVSSNGLQGQRGFSWLSGAGAPTANQVGSIDGDFYLDTTNVGFYYGPRSGGLWGTPHPFGNSLNGVPLINITATTDPGVSNDNTQGYSVGSTWVNITAGRVFFAISVATGAAAWVVLPTRGYLRQTPTTTYNMTVLDRYVFANAVSVGFAVNLISSATAPNDVTIKKIDATANPVTVTPQAGQTIDGAATYLLTSPNQSITLVPNGSVWYVI